MFLEIYLIYKICYLYTTNGSNLQNTNCLKKQLWQKYSCSVFSNSEKGLGKKDTKKIIQGGYNLYTALCYIHHKIIIKNSTHFELKQYSSSSSEADTYQKRHKIKDEFIFDLVTLRAYVCFSR